MNYLAFIQSKTDPRRGFKLKEGRFGLSERVLTGLPSGSWESLALILILSLKTYVST